MGLISRLDPRLRMIAARYLPGGGAPDMDAPRTGVLIELSADAVPEVLAAYDPVHIVDRIYSVAVPESALMELGDCDDIKYIEAARGWYPMLSTSLSETQADLVHTPADGAAGRTGKGVIVGIIDGGMDFTLDDFRHEDGSTRLAFLWDQGLRPEGAERAPDRFHYGVEYDAAAINAALATDDPLGALNHAVEPAAHGTHVAGIAAGNGRSGDADFPVGDHVGTAPEATLIFVQPDRGVGDATGGFTNSRNVVDAIAYIYEKAAALAMPCVINMSLGRNGGSHDGESVVERAIDRLLRGTGRAFVSAAGNDHVWRGHASGQLATGESRSIAWGMGQDVPVPGFGRIPSSTADQTGNEVELWYSSRDRLRVTVRSPAGVASTAIAPDAPNVDEPVGPTSHVFMVSERFSALNGDARVYIRVSPAEGELALEPGIWQIEVEALEAHDGGFDAWIQRDYRGGNPDFAPMQSFFDGEDFDGMSTLSTPATGRRGISVANYDHVAREPSLDSGRGRTRDGRAKPEIAAPGSGIVAAGSLGGRPDGSGGTHPLRVPKSGTSMAAPHVAGIAALLLEEAPDLTAVQLRAILVAAARVPEGVTVFDNAWGFGTVDAVRALRLLRDPGADPAIA